MLIRRRMMPISLSGNADNIFRVYDSFTRTNGALGNSETLDIVGRRAVSKSWVGGTWTVSGNVASNTPILGTDLWIADAAAFTSGIYQWNVLGGNSIANVGNALQVTYVNNGGGAYADLRSNLNLSSNLTVGKWYKFSCDAFMNTGTCQMSVYTGNAAEGSVFSADITTTPSRVEIFFKCYHASNGTVGFANLGTGEVVTIDNCSLIPITNTPELFASIETNYSDMVAYGKLNMVNGGQGGFVVCMDSATNPQNYISIRMDGKYIRWDKCVSGTVTSEVLYIETIYANYLYLQNAELVVEKIGTTVNLYFHGKLIGTKTVSDASIINNKIHGMFSTNSTTTINDFSLRPEAYISHPNVYGMGDSITAAGTWLEGVATAKKWQPIKTAHASTRILGASIYYLTWQADAVKAANTILILMGTNDEVSDDTIRAQYQTQLGVLQAANPTARIIAMGVLKRTTNNAEKIAISAQIEIAASNAGVEYWDTQTWIDPTTDTDDGLHPNASGTAKIIAQVLSRL